MVGVLDGLMQCPVANTTVLVTTTPPPPPPPLSQPFFIANGSLSLHARQLLAATGNDESILGANHSASSSFASNGPEVPFLSTTVLFSIAAAESVLCLIFIAWRYHGLRLLESSDTGDAVRRRRVTPSTNNFTWIVYFLSNALQHAVMIALTQVSTSGDEGSVLERVLELVQRVLLGVTCFALTLSLNHQRLYRTREHRKQKKPSPQLLMQVTWTNRLCGALFLLFSVADFITSNAVSSAKLSEVSNSFFYVYVSMLGVLSVPSVVALVWLLMSDATVQASRACKGLVTFGTIVHLVVMLPPRLWDETLWPGWVASDPCPFAGGHMSAYDVVVIGKIVSLLYLFSFAALEHRRNRLLGQTEHYNEISGRLEDASAENSRANTAPSTPGRISRASELESFLAGS